jgi:hypothetical protein
MDFVIPLHNDNILLRSTIEGVVELYNPNNIYIILPVKYINIINNKINNWLINYTNIILIDEETFFIKNYNMHINDIIKSYKFIDEKSREFGWWYQQLIKLGAVHQIENISNPFVVWDSDLIPFDKWILNENFLFAILQDKPRNEFNKSEYNRSINYLLNLDAEEPSEGTFVPHHYLFYHEIIKHYLKYILENKKYNNWIECIISLSQNYYRFSEYKSLTTFINKFYSDKLKYHKYDTYGKNGKRFRENKEIIEIIKQLCNIENNTISYNEIKKIKLYFNNISYLQVEHLLSN